MKAIVIADVHGDREDLLKLANSVSDKGLDYFFLLGDYSVGFKNPEENRDDIAFILDALKDFSVKAVPGNCDQKDSLQLLGEYNANFHNTVIELPEAAVMGFGGSNPTPFGTPFEFSEEEIYRKLKALLSSTKKKKVLLVHFPPKDTACDVITSGAHVGSASLRKVIEETQPALVLCSHIHESGGREDRIGKTRVMNIGKLSDGRAYMLEIEGSNISVEFYTG